MKSVLVFLAAFIVAAVATLATRAALHEPHADAAKAAAPTAEAHADGHHATHAPAEPSAKPAQPAAAPESHASGHGADEAHAAHGHGAATDAAPVNTICAICGMDVDPDIPTATYQGKTIGFGCRACPPKFKKEPDRYGPAYLKNEKYKR